MAKLHFKYGFDSNQQTEAYERGYLADVFVEIPGGIYSVVFWDSARLVQDLEEESATDRPFIADPGMIVVPSVTLAIIQAAVDRLELERFFDYLVPVK